VSLAEVTSDGEFSAFPGYDRTLLLAARALDLSFDTAPPQRVANPYMPFTFKGEWRCRCCLLNGPVQDFNVMSARAGWHHQCEIIRNTSFTAADVPGIQALIGYCFEGEARVRVAGKTNSNSSAAKHCIAARHGSREGCKSSHWGRSPCWRWLLSRAGGKRASMRSPRRRCLAVSRRAATKVVHNLSGHIRSRY